MSVPAMKTKSPRKSGTGGRIRVCKRCKFSTSDGKEFLHHQLTEHSTEAIEVFACEKCDYISHVYEDLIQHKRTLHPQPSSSSSSSARKHPSQSSAQHATNTTTTTSTTVDDIANIAARRSLTVTSPDAAEERYNDLSLYAAITYSCDKCGATCSTPREHYRHQKEAHDSGAAAVYYECERCDDYATKSENRLRKHLLRHAEEEEEEFEYREGVSEENFVPEGTDEDSSSQGPLQIDEGDGSNQANEEHDFKSPLQIVMEMNQASSNVTNRTMFPTDNKMSAAFIAAMSHTLAANRKPAAAAVPSSMARSRVPPSGAPGKRCAPVREAVDPAKYMTIQEGDGIKYACSKCGNIYKWRKSLNKHWKEKHDGEVPDPRSTAVTALTIPSRISNSNIQQHLMGLGAAAGQSVLIPGKAGLFRPISTQAVSPIRPQPMFNVSATHYPASLTRPAMLASHSSIPVKPASPPSSSTTSLMSSFHPSTASFIPRPIAVSPQTSSPGLHHHQPPAAHGHKTQPFLSPPSSRKSSTSIYDEPFDEQEGVLDLSKKSNPAPEVSQASPPQPPLQEQPIDFSSYPVRYPPPPLSADPSRRHLISPHRPGTAHSPIVIEPSALLACSPPPQQPQQLQHCDMCSYSGTSAQELDEHRQLHRGTTTTAQQQQRQQQHHQCAECPDAFGSVEQLTGHFSVCHSDVLQQKLREQVAGGGGDEDGDDAMRRQLHRWLTVDPSLRPASHTIGQETTCLVCGAYYQWQDGLASHFSMAHSQLPNPYTLQLSASPPHPSMESPLHGGSDNDPTCTSPAPSKSSEELLMTTPDGKMLNFDTENTAIVIPVAPEESTPTTPRKKPGRKSNTVHSLDKAASGGEDSAELLLPYKCTVCEYRARWPSEITQHMKNHSDEKPYKCPRCSYRSKWKWDVVKHLKRCGGGTVKDVIDTTKIRRQMHVNAILAGVPSLGASPVLPQARELSRGPPNVTVVPSREQSMDESEDTGSSEEHSLAGGGGAALPQHFCSHCPFVANSSAELRRHGRIHSEDKPYICKTCGYCSKWKCDLKKHLRTYDHQSAVPLTYGGHGRKPADWDKESKDEMMSDEEMEDLVQCKQCDFTASHPQYLEDHMSAHHMNKPAAGKLKCKQCDFSVDDLPSFLQHNISHQSVPSQNKDVDAPQMKHRRKPLKQNITKTVQEAEEEGGMAAYPCEWCTFTADKSLELYQHVRTEHPEDMELESEAEPRERNAEGKENEIQPVIECEWCTWSTNDREEMYNHMEVEHQDDISGERGDMAEIKIYRGELRKVAKRRLKHCDKCAYVTDNISTLQRHMSKHGKKAKYSCTYCDYSVEREHIIEYHMSHVHKDDYSVNHNAHVMQRMEEEDYEDQGDEEEEEEDEAYFGQEENSMDSEKADINGDVDGETPEKRRGYTVLQIHQGKRTRYACQKCPYKTENLTNMSNHARQHGANKKYTCELCDYSLDQWRHIAKHMKTQHGHNTDNAPEDGGIHDDSEATNGLDEDAEEEDEDELTDVSENEWEIAEVDGSVVDEDTPTKRRRLSRISTSSAQSSILKYTCKTCGFNTLNKALVAKHNHKEESEAHEDKLDDKEPNVDINRNTTEVAVQ